jgi:hypothetical protein
MIPDHCPEGCELAHDVTHQTEGRGSLKQTGKFPVSAARRTHHGRNPDLELPTIRTAQMRGDGADRAEMFMLDT